MHVHAIIIGGGIAGLYTAYKLVSDNYNIILIEKNVRLGGRIHTIYTDAYQYEAGAGRLSKKHIRLMKLINTFNLSIEPIPSQRNYRSVGCGSIVATKNASATRIARVCSVARTLGPSVLRSMTFRQLCEKILGIQAAATLVNEFGYNAEFFYLNAADAVDLFSKDFVGNQSYYVCKEGLSELVSRMENVLLSSGKAKILGCEAIQVKQNKQYGYMKVIARLNTGDTRIFKSDIVVCALPKNELSMLVNNSVNEARKLASCQALLDTVEAIPLHRVYSKFSRGWFQGIPATTTDDQLRQFIPIDNARGIAMVSYSDTNYADYWNGQAMSGEKNLRAALLKHLHVVFPEVQLPRMQWVNSHYWETGVHMWKQGVNSSQVRPKIQQLLGADIPVFVVGEAYSSHQSWIEGALVTVDEIYSRLHAFMHKGGSTQIGTVVPRIKEKSIQEFVATRGITHYIMLKTNGKKRLLDVDQWMNSHPGGKEWFIRYHGKDVTNDWPKIHYVGDPRNRLINPDIMKIINTITVAFVVP